MLALSPSCIYLPDAHTSKDISIKNVCPRPLHLVLDKVPWIFANAPSPAAYLPTALLASRHFCRDAFQHLILQTPKNKHQSICFVCLHQPLDKELASLASLSLICTMCTCWKTFQEEERMHSSISVVEMRNYHSVRICRAADNWTFSRSLSISVHSLFCICYDYQQHKVLYTSHHTVIHPIHPTYSTTMLHPSEMTFLMHTYLYVNLNMWCVMCEFWNTYDTCIMC